MPLYSNFRFKALSNNVDELIDSASIENIQNSISKYFLLFYSELFNKPFL